MNKGLLTKADIVRFTPVALPFNPCTLREAYLIEYTEATSCIGADLWQAMVDALADYSSASAYDSETTYQVGNVVSFKGVYRQATVETSQIPDFSDHWTDAPKFTGDNATDFNELYCTFLGPYLAHVVLSERLPYIVTQLTDEGITYGGRKYNAQDAERIKSLERAIFRDREKIYNALKHYLSQPANVENEAFAGWIENSEVDACACNKSTCNVCQKRRPRNVGRYRIG